VGEHRPVLAVLGGSFNPPHLGHALLTSYVFARGLADRVLVAPCWDHPLGKNLIPFERRMSWTRLALAHGRDDRVEVSAIERELAQDNSGRPSYTLELLTEVARRHPDYRVRLVVGSDITASGEVARWHRWDAIMASYEPIVVPRVGWSAPGEAALPQISSTIVRERFDTIRAGGEPAEQALRELSGLLPAAVVGGVRAWLRGEEPRIWVVGRGNVASHAIPWLHDRGFEVIDLGARDLIAGAIEAPSDRPPDGVWVLGRDMDLPKIAAALRPWLHRPTPVLHGAGGRIAREVLAPLHDAGHPVGTLHPICSLRRERMHSRLSRASFGVEGDEPALTLARRIIGDAPTLELEGMSVDARVAYHAACALVANHLAVIEQAGVGELERIGLDGSNVRTALTELMASSLDNLRTLGVPDGITGPLVRGDRAMVERHLEALHEPARSLYAELSTRLASLLPA
jgi:nicotinate (nicotinamide) nucleotide adenylyltransferase